MDQLGAPSGVVPGRRTTALQAAAVATSVLAAAAAGAWPFVGGGPVERLVVTAQGSAPTPATESPSAAPRRAADGTRPRLHPVLAAPVGPPVSTTAATAVVLVAGPVEDVVGTERAMAAYRAAAGRVGDEDPGCRLSWSLLASIGLVESGHGTVHGSALHADGRAVPPILGPRLDGGGFAHIVDSDGGALDGDGELDRAVGPMQFIPSTWARWGADGDGDGEREPQDVDDAALAAGRYLCASGARLDRPAGLLQAVFGRNHSVEYVRLVLTVTARYLGVPPARLGVDRLPAPEPVLPPAPPPVEAVPVEAVPVDGVPGEAVPVEAVPAEQVAAEEVPARAAPAEAPADVPATHGPPPDGATTGDPAPEGAAPEPTEDAEREPAATPDEHDPASCPTRPTEPTDPPDDDACPTDEVPPAQDQTPAG